MIKIEKSIFINRPKQEVFKYVTNPANNVQWQKSTQSAEWTSDSPPGVGSTFKIVNRFLLRNIEAINEITAWEPPNTVTVKSVKAPVPFESTYTFEAHEGGTQMTFKSQAEIGGLFKLLVSKQFQKQLDTSLNALKLVLESG